MLIAIDPGAKGGIAVYENGNTLISKLPEHDNMRILALKALREKGHERIYIENQTGFGGEHQAGMFAFGVGFGMLIGAGIALGFDVRKVTPHTWQKCLNLGRSGRQCAPKGATTEEKMEIRKANSRAKTDWKNALKSHAQSLYPNAHITLDTCDALLLLEYAKTLASD